METLSLKDVKIAVIGAGNMSEALLHGILGSAVIDPSNVRVSDLDSAKLERLKEQFSVFVDTSNSKVAERADVCLLAVKPQVLPEVLADTLPGLKVEALILSIAAGISTDKIESILPEGRRVVRVMPNTPALIGMGIAALSAGANATEQDLDLAEIIIGTTGQTVRVEERLLDAVTAVSGSGPAYLFYFIENMIAAGVDMGLDAELAANLSCATIEGAVRLMIESGLKPEELRRRVTSEGGTTAAAIAEMDRSDMGRIIRDAMTAARDRSVEISQT